MKADFIPDAKTCLLLKKLMNKAISCQTTQIYNTLSPVPWKDRRDEIAYSQKDTFCLGSQPFRPTSCVKQVLYRVVLTVTVAAEGELWKQSLPSDNEASQESIGSERGCGFSLSHRVSMWRMLWSRRKAAWYFVYIENLKKTVSKRRGRFCWGTYPSQGAFGSMTLFKSMWL